MLDLKQYLHIAGEHSLFLDGEVGLIEAVLSVPDAPLLNRLALLGHPHSLQGGTMNNKVVTTLARAFRELHIPSLRFNFRGVGKTEGHYDEGIGESQDMIRLAIAIEASLPSCQFLFAGFSFGSYVAYRAAAHYPAQLLITIAPPVHHYDYSPWAPVPWEVIQGEQDEVVPFDLVETFCQDHTGIHLTRFAETGHFFHGKLLRLKDSIIERVTALGVNA